MKALLPLIAGVLLLVPQLSAQSAKTRARKAAPKPPAVAVPVASGKYPLRRINIKGNNILTAQQIESVAGLPLNKPLGKTEFDQARDRLLATGYFESVGFVFGPIDAAGPAQGYEATFEVTEVPSVYGVDFENLPLATSEIEGALKAANIFYGAKIPGTQQVLAFYSSQIEHILAVRNHPARVVAELVPAGKSDYKILFRSAEALPSVAFVTFTGNKAISAILLQNAINDVAFGAPFSKDHFRLLLDNQVRPLYEAKGMVRVAFPSFSTEPAPKVKGLLVHVTVEEGPVYNLSKISLEGVDPDYMEYITVKPGSPANFDQINEALASVKYQMKRNGYLDAQGSLERVIDDKAKTVEVTARMVPGPQFTMGSLAIEGLDLNSEPAVRKLWIVQEGKPFNGLYPDYFLKRIREDGLFDGLGTTKSTVQRNDEKHTVDVTLLFGSSPKPGPKRRQRPMDEQPTESSKPPIV